MGFCWSLGFTQRMKCGWVVCRLAMSESRSSLNLQASVILSLVFWVLRPLLATSGSAAGFWLLVMVAMVRTVEFSMRPMSTGDSMSLFFSRNPSTV